MSIEVTHITKQYGRQFAVNNISFHIPKGQTCGFLGPNGAGKSTTLKLITGFLQPDEGTILINGIDVQQQPNKTKQSIGYLAEHNALYKDMYVKEFLRFIASLHQLKNKADAVDAVIEQTGLQKEAHKLIGQLSKGYQQRVGLAQALIHNPSVLILDEPLSGLDPNQLAELRNLIRNLGKEKTVLFSSHILQEVEQVANRILMINNGEIVMDELQGENEQQSTFTLIQFEEKLSAAQWDELAEIGSISNENQFIRMQGSSEQQRKAVFAFAVKHNLSLLRLEQRNEDLSTLFKQKTSSTL